MKIVETENYWLVDQRYKIRPLNIFLSLLCLSIGIGAYIYFGGNQLLGSPSSFMVFAFAMFILYTLTNLIFSYRGLLVNIYQKNWVEIEKTADELKMNITLPKYSKDAIWKLRYGNKLLDFAGVTVSSSEIRIEYSFKLN